MTGAYYSNSFLSKLQSYADSEGNYRHVPAPALRECEVEQHVQWVFVAHLTDAFIALMDKVLLLHGLSLPREEIEEALNPEEGYHLAFLWDRGHFLGFARVLHSESTSMATIGLMLAGDYEHEEAYWFLLKRAICDRWPGQITHLYANWTNKPGCMWEIHTKSKNSDHPEFDLWHLYVPLDDR